MKASKTLVALLLATGCSTSALNGEAGKETGACIEGSCFDGLECLSDLCVGSGDTDADDDGPADDDDGPGPSTTAAPTTGQTSDGPDSSNPSDPTLDPSDPTSDPSDPTSDPSDPTSDPSDPTSDPSDPTSDPSDGSSTTDDSSGEESSTGDDSDSDTTGMIECDPPMHDACDDTGGAFAALGINCVGEPQFNATAAGTAAAIGVRSSFGSTGNWNPTEGDLFAVIGTGFTADLDMAQPPGDPNTSPTHCSDDLGAEHDFGSVLPSPLTHIAANGDCTNNPGLIGTGDCSGSMEAPFIAGTSANDYTELRIEGTTPGGARSVSFDFAFFSTEFPAFVDSNFNDMFVAWVESESWTGNVALDPDGEVISAASSAMDVLDPDVTNPDLAGTCMEGHGGSNWRRTAAPLSAGDDFTLVFAIFDMSDSIFDSYAFVDNVSFGCQDLDEPETQAL